MKLRLVLSLLALSLLAACSTVSSRIEKNPSAFTALSRDHQNLVREGKVCEGMSKDAVYLAWGKPDDIARGSDGGVAEETWTYFAAETVPSGYDYIGVRHYGRSGRVYYEPMYQQDYDTRFYPIRRATFRGGKVVAWKSGYGA